MMRFGCLGMATLDTLLFCKEPRFGHDAVNVIEDIVVSPGGKGLVTAVAIERSGGTAVPFALTGCNSEVADMLPTTIDSGYLRRLLDSDSRVWATVSADHEVVTFVAVGVPQADEKQLGTEARAFVDDVDALYLTVEEPALLGPAAQRARDTGRPLAINLSRSLLGLLHRTQPGLLGKLVSSSNILLCNEAESKQTLAMLHAADWSRVEAPRLQEVVITAGASGGRVSAPPFTGWHYYDAAQAVAVRCVVGAGDTFNGAYLVARISDGASMLKSCQLGAQAAARKVAYRGSSLPLT